MADNVSIANRALSKLGAGRILLLTDDNQAARTINQMFNDVRDAELRRHRWKFALTRDSLPALATVPAFGFSYQYPLPADYLAMVQVNDYFIRAGSPNSGLYSIEAGNILTDLVAPLKIRYVKRVTNPGLFDPLFVEALACKLAMEACETLTQSETKFARMADQYKFAMTEAVRVDAIEKVPDELPQGSWLDSRGYSGTGGQTVADMTQYASGFSV